MSTRATGIALAFATAVVSGVSIYVNAHAVKHFGDATAYTTAKNGVAGLLLTEVLLWLQIDLLGVHRVVARVLAAGVVFLFNFGLRKALLFTRRGVAAQRRIA